MFTLSVLIRQFLVLCGAALMIWGIWMPLLGMKIFRDQTFYDLSPTGGIILVTLAAVSVIIALFKKWWGLYLTGILALILLFYTVGEIQDRKDTLDSDFKSHVASGPIKDTLRGLVSTTRVRHGFFVMASGAVVVILVPLVWGRVIIRRKEKESKGSHESATS